MKSNQIKGKVFITDYIENSDIEREILGDYISNFKDDGINFINEEIEYLLVWHQKIDEDYLSKFPNLKGIVRYGVGYDKIDLKACKRKKIAFCNTPDYGTEEVSNTAVSMVMDCSRKVSEYNYIAKNIYNGSWQENTIQHIKRNNKINVGIIGCGRIGSSVILKLNSLNFNTFFYDPFVNWGFEKVLNSERYTNLESLLSQCDIISIHCPLNESTVGIINKSFLNSMKHNSTLINTARGELVEDIDFLFEFLKSKKIYSVYLDVLPDEPPNNNKALIKEWKSNSELSSRIIINPHTAYYSKESFLEMRTKAAKNILRMINKEPLHYQIV